MTAAARVVVVISSNLFMCTFYGGIWGFVRGRGVKSCCGGSSLAHHFHHCQYHTKTPPSQPAALSSSPHSIHLTMALLVIVIVVTLIGL